MGMTEKIAEIAEEIAGCVKAGGIVWTFGCGGSAAQADHLAAELVGRLHRDRPPIPAVSLSGAAPAVTSCIGNDFGFHQVYARQVAALATPADVVIGISTSGKSPVVVNGLIAGRGKFAYTVALTGQAGIACLCDAVVRVPSTVTQEIQDAHSMICHALAAGIEEKLFQ